MYSFVIVDPQIGTLPHHSPNSSLAWWIEGSMGLYPWALGFYCGLKILGENTAHVFSCNYSLNNTV